MVKIKNKMYKVLVMVMFLIWGFITYSSIFNVYQIRTCYGKPVLPFLVLLGVSVLLLFLVMIYKKIENYNEKIHNKIALIIIIISFVLLISFGLTYQVIATYDLSHIVDQVKVLLNNHTHIVGDNNYFSIYPNQIPLFVFVYFISSFTTIINIDPNNFMIIINCILIALSFGFTYKIIKKLFDSRIALIGLILLVLCPDFYLYASYYYTDILCIPFSIIGYYCLIMLDYEPRKRRYLYGLIAGIMFAIGCKLRVVSVFLLIAFIIDVILKNNIKNIIKKLTTVMISFTFIIMLYNKVVEPYFCINIDNKFTLPATHWIMMGSNADMDGGYDIADVRYTISLDNKVNENMKEINKRIKSQDLLFVGNKIRRVWSSGEYDSLHKYQNVSKIDNTYNILTSNGSIVIRYIQQVLKATIYLLFLITIGSQLSSKNKYEDSQTSSLIISIFGAIVFYLFWEALSRYSFSFLPWIVIGCSVSITSINHILTYKTISFDKEKIKLIPLKRNLGIFIIVCMTLYVGIGFFEYCIKKVQQPQIINSQAATNAKLKIEGSGLKQEFTISRDFNNISLFFYVNKKMHKQDYKFELYNESDELLYYRKFNTDRIKVKDIVDFKFPKEKVNSKKTYYFKIYPLKEDEEDKALHIKTYVIDNCTSNQEKRQNNGYDVNPNGKTYMDDKLVCDEVSLIISNVNKHATIGKKYYIPIALVVLFITFISVNSLLLKNNVVKPKVRKRVLTHKN